MSNRTEFLENDDSFSSSLYQWMNRAPWLAISAAAHLLLLLFLLAIPWDMLREDTVCVLLIHPEAPQELPFEPPPDEILPDIETEVPTEDPQLIEDVPVIADVPTDEHEPIQGDPLFDSNAPFQDFGEIPTIGIGAGAGGPFGSRLPGSGGRRSGGGSPTEISVAQGLEWLAAHQALDGSWDCDGFSAQCGSIGATTCGDAGEATHDE